MLIVAALFAARGTKWTLQIAKVWSSSFSSSIMWPKGDRSYAMLSKPVIMFFASHSKHTWCRPISFVKRIDLWAAKSSASAALLSCLSFLLNAAMGKSSKSLTIKLDQLEYPPPVHDCCRTRWTMYKWKNSLSHPLSGGRVPVPQLLKILLHRWHFA